VDIKPSGKPKFSILVYNYEGAISSPEIPGFFSFIIHSLTII